MSKSEATHWRSLWHGRLRLGDDWACYLGPVSQQTLHAHVAAQIAVGLSEAVTVQTAAFQEICGRAVLIPPLTRHRVVPVASLVLLIYADPRGRLGRMFRLRAAENIAAVPAFGAALLASWNRANGLPGEQEILAALNKAFPHAATQELDDRVQRALKALEEQRGRGIESIAGAHAGLSAGRLRELAQKELGTSLAHFSLWRKLQHSLRSATSGESLADAAYAGGFADQAHMARTFRKMLGLTLTDLIRTKDPPSGAVHGVS